MEVTMKYLIILFIIMLNACSFTYVGKGRDVSTEIDVQPKVKVELPVQKEDDALQKQTEMHPPKQSESKDSGKKPSYLATYCYEYGEEESIAQAKEKARIRVKRIAAESIRSYVKSDVTVENASAISSTTSMHSEGCLANINYDDDKPVHDKEQGRVCYTIISADFDPNCKPPVPPIQNENDHQKNDGNYPVDATRKDPTPDIRIPQFVDVPKKTYTKPDFLVPYFHDYHYSSNTFEINYDFKIMVRELSVYHFQQYYDTLDTEQQNELGDSWKKADVNAPVDGIPYKYVTGYKNWLSEISGKTIRFPSIEEWMAACIHYYTSQDRLLNQYKPIYNKEEPISKIRQHPDHLLGNLREWSSTPCEENQKRFVLGANYMSSAIGLFKATCANIEASWLGGIGIRLVMTNTALTFAKAKTCGGLKCIKK